MVILHDLGYGPTSYWSHHLLVPPPNDASVTHMRVRTRQLTRRRRNATSRTQQAAHAIKATTTTSHQGNHHPHPWTAATTSDATNSTCHQKQQPGTQPAAHPIKLAQAALLRQHTLYSLLRSTTPTHPSLLRSELERLLARLLVSHCLLSLLEGSALQLEFIHLAGHRSIARIFVGRAHLPLLPSAITLLILFRLGICL